MVSTIDGSPVSTRDLESLALTNFGHFTSFRVENGQVRGLQMHLGRLRRDARLVFGVQLDVAQVREYMREAVAGRTGDLFMRVTVFDPRLGLAGMGGDAQPQILVSVRAAGTGNANPLKAKTFPFTRDTAAVKHIGLFSQFHYRRQAILAGFDDAIFVERDARVSEGATWNLGFVTKSGDIVWPDAPVLPGVTMLLLQRALPTMHTAPVSLGSIHTMRAAFATNAGFGVRPISRIDAFEYPTDDSAITTMQRVYAQIQGDDL